MTANAANNTYSDEIDKFDATAHGWWDLKGAQSGLHDINPLRLQYIDEKSGVTDPSTGAVTGGIAGKKVMDVGCGGGILAESLARHGAASVVGVDMASGPLRVAREHAAAHGVTNITYVQANISKLAEDPEHKGQYDVVTCMEMLEHVPSPAAIVAACGKLVKPGGHVFFSTINRNFKSWVFAIIGAEYILRLLPIGSHDHKKFITTSELDTCIVEAGLRARHWTGLHYNPFTFRYWLAPNTDVNYMVHTTVATGEDYPIA